MEVSRRRVLAFRRLGAGGQNRIGSRVVQMPLQGPAEQSGPAFSGHCP